MITIAKDVKVKWLERLTHNLCKATSDLKLDTCGYIFFDNESILDSAAIHTPLYLNITASNLPF